MGALILLIARERMSILLSLPLYYFAFVPIELVQLNYRNNRHFMAISGADDEKTLCKDIQYLRNFTSHYSHQPVKMSVLRIIILSGLDTKVISKTGIHGPPVLNFVGSGPVLNFSMFWSLSDLVLGPDPSVWSLRSRFWSVDP